MMDFSNCILAAFSPYCDQGNEPLKAQDSVSTLVFLA